MSKIEKKTEKRENMLEAFIKSQKSLHRGQKVSKDKYVGKNNNAGFSALVTVLFDLLISIIASSNIASPDTLVSATSSLIAASLATISPSALIPTSASPSSFILIAISSDAHIPIIISYGPLTSLVAFAISFISSATFFNPPVYPQSFHF